MQSRTGKSSTVSTLNKTTAIYFYDQVDIRKAFLLKNTCVHMCVCTQM